MSIGDNVKSTRDVLNEIVSIFSTGNLNKIPEVISPEYVDHQGLSGIKIRGQQGFARVVTAARKGLSNLQVVTKDVIVEDEKVAARLEWHGVNADGENVVRETIDILRVESGQLVEHWGTRLSFTEPAQHSESEDEEERSSANYGEPSFGA